MNYSYIKTSTYVSVINLDTGVTTRISSDNARFNEALNFVKQGKFDKVEAMNVRNEVDKMVSAVAATETPITVELVGNRLSYTVSGVQYELNNAMSSRIVAMATEGFSVKPLLKFLERVLLNPSKTAVEELYLFLEATELPITDDGCFIAYKIVRNDYTSHYDHKFRNDVGTTPEMPRNQVDDNRNRTCSQGLHFCSKGYLKSYGSGNDRSDRLLLVKVDPADVVSIPSDYNNAKGRASKYLIWKDISEPGWREKYFAADYNTRSVEVGFDDDCDVDCPNCGSENVNTFGSVYVCRNCKYEF